MTRICLLFSLLVSMLPFLAGQDSLQYERHHPVHRGFDTLALKEFAANPHYRYDRQAPEDSLLRRWWEHFKDMLRSALQEGELSVQNILILISIVIALAGLIYFLIHSRMGGIFIKKDDTYAGGRILDTTIPDVPIATLIRQAIDERDFRSAFRWTYIDLLRKLHDQKALRLHRDKTNRDYKREMAEHSRSMTFSALADAFDQVWYGDYPIDEKTLEHHSQSANDILFQGK